MLTSPQPDIQPTPTVPLTALDRQALLALNNAHARELSELDADLLHDLIVTAAFARGVAPAEAFLLAFDDRAALATPNFHWFRARLPRFLYVDRIVVAERARGRGLARLLYGELFAAAAALGHDVIACEVNSEPPNPASDALHAALGFERMGEAHLPARGKTVTYLVRRLPT